MKHHYLAIAVLCGAALAVSAIAEDKLVPLQTSLPKPQFQGTPVPFNIPNLDKPGKKEPVQIPEGCVNLALKKPVTSSDQFPVIGELNMVTDGSKEGVEGSFVELGPGDQWVQIDLGQKSKIYALAMWLYHAQARVYHDVIIQISDDKDFISGVKTVFNNDHDNSSGMGIGKDPAYIEGYEGRQFKIAGVEGRYVRVHTKGNTSNEMNHFTEIEVSGKKYFRLSKM